MKTKLLLIITLLSAINLTGQDILINEFMEKNNTTIQDEDGDYSDWIELYNPTDTPINIENYSLSDDGSDINKWSFPELTILPQSYLLIFASNKNRLDLTELHTNFKISSSGEELYLSNNLGNIIDHINPIILSSDESYGRMPDGSTNWIITNTPTPNSFNNGSNQLIFSHQEGFYTSPFSLIINSYLEDTIYYTLNGNIPTENSTIFTDALLVKNKSSEPNIVSEVVTTAAQDLISYKAWESPSELLHKATILRCVSYRNGERTSKIYTKTFFVDEEMYDKYSMPIVSLITDNENLFSLDSGLYLPGINYDSTNPEWTGNYYRKGSHWERDVHIEFFKNDGTLCFSQDAGLRIHGGKTRQASQKSLRLYAKSEYGEKYFNYKIFPNKPVEKYKRFILETTMGAWRGQSVIKDVLAQNIASSLNLEYQDFQPVIVYLNGEYWGIHTIRDKIDDRYIAYTHNVDPDSVEFNAWYNTDYNDLTQFIEDNDLSINSNYEHVLTQIDIDNYIDYTIAELFFGNFDWPTNNMKQWRALPDGKWRWILFDLDGGLYNEDIHMLYHATTNDSSIVWPNSPASTFLFRNLLKNNTFRSQMVNRYAEILNNEFDIERTTNKLDSIKEIYSVEMDKHIDRWNFPNSMSVWEEDVKSLLDFMKARPCVVEKHIMDYFNLSNFDFECSNPLYISDDLVVVPNPNNGSFYLFNNVSNIRNATFIITSINGQTIFREDNVTLKKNEEKYFYLTSLPSNTYILQIISDAYSAQKKIVIIR